MVKGIGIDLVKISRIERAMSRWPEAFARRVLTSAEYDYCSGHKRMHESVAARFCAKEAIMKAFGTGLSGGVSWQDAEVLPDANGKPVVRLSGRLAEVAATMGVVDAMVSISHDGEYAIAQAMLV